MRPEDRLLFTCTRQTFGNVHAETVQRICADEQVCWSAVFVTAKQHGVAPLIYANLQQCDVQALGILRPVVDSFERCTLHNIALKSGVAVKIAEVLSKLHQNGIDVMLVKGATLDILVYKQPWYTIHDVDLVIRPQRVELSNSYTVAIEALFNKLPGFEYEHFTHHDVTMNNLLPVDFQRIWDNATLVDYRGQTVWVMCPEDLLLASCINACRKRFFRLKSLLDITEIVNHYPNMNWKQFASQARVERCNLIVYTALLVTKMTVGCSMPDWVLDDLAVSPLRRVVIRHLVRYLLQYLPLSAAYPFTGRQLLGKHLTWSLLLTYASYTPDQGWRKLRQAFCETMSTNAKRYL